MRYSNERSFQAQLSFLRRQFLQDGGCHLLTFCVVKL